MDGKSPSKLSFHFTMPLLLFQFSTFTIFFSLVPFFHSFLVLFCSLPTSMRVYLLWLLARSFHFHIFHLSLLATIFHGVLGTHTVVHLRPCYKHYHTRFVFFFCFFLLLLLLVLLPHGYIGLFVGTMIFYIVIFD